MRTVLTRSFLFVMVLVLVVSGGAVFAQDMMDDAKVICDADLILSLYNAEYHFDYAAIHDQAVANGADPGFSLSDFEYGQFAPLFDSMMSMMDESMSLGMMAPETMSALVDAMSMGMGEMDEDMMSEDSMMDTMSTLPSGDVPDEPAACTALRANLRQFYTALAYENTSSGM